MKIKTPVQKIVEYSEHTNTINKQALDNLLIEEENLILKEIKDALDRGHALGFVDGISMSQGKPESSNSEQARKFHIEQIKETYFER